MKIFTKAAAKVTAIAGVAGTAIYSTLGHVGAAWSGDSLVPAGKVAEMGTDTQNGFKMMFSTLFDFSPQIILVVFGSMALGLIGGLIGGGMKYRRR